jgi:hypothetical protein
MAEIAEPREGTIVCWFDPNDDLFAVFHRTDQHEDGPHRWYNADQYDTSYDGPMTWSELLSEMDGHRGPVELVSSGRLHAGAEHG